MFCKRLEVVIRAMSGEKIWQWDGDLGFMLNIYLGYDEDARFKCRYVL
jgi:hypothetical protein